MADKTYLQLINKVMINLREEQVASLSEDYTLLIGEFVNQAKEAVEDTWHWHRLRKWVAFTTDGLTNEFDLSDTAIVGVSPAPAWLPGRSHLIRDRFRRALAVDTTTGSRTYLTEINGNGGIAQVALDDYTSTIESPGTWFMDGSVFTFTRYPTASHTINVRVYCPQDELTSTTDTMTVPWRPVVDYATALAYDERGEELGNQMNTYMSRYEANLARAVSNDVGANEDEMVMESL
jgi:hypothetical protein